MADPRQTKRSLLRQQGILNPRPEEVRHENFRNNDFFDAANFPQITFKSTEAEAIDHNTYRLTGDLTIKGITKPVTVDFEYTGTATDPFGNIRIGFEGTTTINRKDWGVAWNAALDAGGVLVSDKVTLEFDISAIKVGQD